MAIEVIRTKFKITNKSELKELFSLIQKNENSVLSHTMNNVCSYVSCKCYENKYYFVYYTTLFIFIAEVVEPELLGLRNDCFINTDEVFLKKSDFVNNCTDVLIFDKKMLNITTYEYINDAIRCDNNTDDIIFNTQNKQLYTTLSKKFNSKTFKLNNIKIFEISY